MQSQSFCKKNVNSININSKIKSDYDHKNINSNNNDFSLDGVATAATKTPHLRIRETNFMETDHRINHPHTCSSNRVHLLQPVLLFWACHNLILTTAEPRLTLVFQCMWLCGLDASPRAYDQNTYKIWNAILLHTLERGTKQQRKFIVLRKRGRRSIIVLVFLFWWGKQLTNYKMNRNNVTRRYVWEKKTFCTFDFIHYCFVWYVQILWVFLAVKEWMDGSPFGSDHLFI